jgi:hypothetical protein
MFTARTTAKIITCYQYLTAVIGRFVKHKIGFIASIIFKPHFMKEVGAKARPLDCFQELLWDNHVSIDIQKIQGCCDTC